MLRRRALQHSARLVACVIPAVVAACQEGGSGSADTVVVGRSPGESARQLAVEVDRLRPSMAKREWTSAAGDAAATVVAHFSHDTLRLIRERLDQGDYGTASNRYYYDARGLRYYESEGEQRDTDQAQANALRKTRLVLAFDSTGQIAESTRLVDGQPAPVDSVMVRGVRARSGALLRQVAENIRQ